MTARGGPDPHAAAVRTGRAELAPVPERPGAWTLLVNGAKQSSVDPGAPGWMPFDYVRRIAAVLRLAGPPGVPLRVLHLGAGALALPRYLDHLRPGSRQTVVELDDLLLALVTRVLPPPAGVEFVIGDARAALAELPAAAFDVVISDVFVAAHMPDSVAGTSFARAAARVLRPGGLFAMNVTDVPPLAYTRIRVATLRAAFGDVAMIATGSIPRGRKAGNVVLVAGHAAGDVPVGALRIAALRDAEPARVFHGTSLDEFTAGARARLD